MAISTYESTWKHDGSDYNSEPKVSAKYWADLSLVENVNNFDDLDFDAKRSNLKSSTTTTTLQAAKTEWGNKVDLLDMAYEKTFDDYIANNPDILKLNKTSIKNNFISYLNSLQNTNTTNSNYDKYWVKVNEDALSAAGIDITKVHTKIELDNLEKQITKINYQSGGPEIWQPQNTKKPPFNYQSSKYRSSEGVSIEYPDDMNFYEENEDIIDIFDDNKYKNVKKAVFEQLKNDNGDIEVKKRHFGINLWLDGLAGIVAYIERNDLRDVTSDRNSGDDIKDLSDKRKIQKAYKKWKKKSEYTEYENLTETFDYKRDGGIDRERSKIVKIIQDLGQNNRGELLEYSNLVLSAWASRKKTAINRYNQEITTNEMAEDLNNWTNARDLDITPAEIFTYLSDYNNDGNLAVSWRGVDNQWDTGTIFWQQLEFGIQRAIAEIEWKRTSSAFYQDLINDEYGASPATPATWENIVIFNILKTVRVISQDIGWNVFGNDEWSINLSISECTVKNLHAITINNPSFQPLFAQAILNMNGATDYIRNNLHDQLTGVTRLNIQPDPYTAMEDYLENDFFKSDDGKEVLERIWADSYEEIKHGLVPKIMSLIGNLEVEAGFGDNRDLEELRGSAQREVWAKRNMFIKAFAREFLWAIVGFEKDPDTGETKIKIWPSASRKWTSESGRRKRDLDATAALKLSLKDFKNIWDAGFEVRLGGSVSRQYNFKTVVTSSLDQLGTANYVWVDALVDADRALKDIAQWNLTPWVDVRLWLHQQRDKEVAINQRHEQFDAVLDLTLNLDSAGLDELDDATLLQEHLILWLEQYERRAKVDDTWMWKFVENNRTYLESSIKMFCASFEENKVLDNLSWALNETGLKAYFEEKNPGETFDYEDVKRIALQNMLNDMKRWVVANSKNAMIAGLEGDTKITKVWAGVGLSFGTNKAEGEVIVPNLLPHPFNLIYWEMTISTYLNYYTTSAVQLEMISEDIRKGWRVDMFTPDQNLPAYATYLQNFFVQPDDVTFKQSWKEWQLEIENDIKIEESSTTELLEITVKSGKITDFIEIRCINDEDILKNVKFSNNGKKLIIGDVGSIVPQIVYDWTKARYRLLLWTDKTEATASDGSAVANTVILWPWHNKSTQTSKLETIWTTNEFVEYTRTAIDSLLTKDQDFNDPNEAYRKDAILQFFDINWNFINNIWAAVTGIIPGEKLTDGTFTVTETDTGTTVNYTKWTPAWSLKIEYVRNLTNRTPIDIQNEIIDKTGSEFLTSGNDDEKELVLKFFNTMTWWKIDKLTASIVTTWTSPITINSIIYDNSFNRDNTPIPATGNIIFTHDSNWILTVRYIAGGSELSIDYIDGMTTQLTWQEIINDVLAPTFSQGQQADITQFFSKPLTNITTLINPTGINWIGWTPSCIWQQLNQWELTVEKFYATDGVTVIGYKMNYDNTPTGQLKINLIEHTPAITGAPMPLTNLLKFSTSWGLVEKQLAEAETHLTSLVDFLKDEESGEEAEFKLRLEQILTPSSWEIDDDEFDEAFVELEKFVPKSDANYTNLYNYLSTGYPETRAFIYDQLKAYFAIQPWYDWQNISSLANSRGNTYKSMTGPSALNFNSYNSGLISEITRCKDASRTKIGSLVYDYPNHTEEKENLLWYTAFYRKSWDAKKYGMTAPWATKIVKWSIEPIENWQKEHAKDRFLGNLKYNKYERQTLALMLAKQVKAIDNTFDVNNITKDNVIELIQNGELKLDNTNQILKLDFDMVFYLLWECANESIGIELEDITLYDDSEITTSGATSNGIHAQGLQTQQSRDATGTPEHKIDLTIGWWTHVAAMQINTKRYDKTFRIKKSIPTGIPPTNDPNADLGSPNENADLNSINEYADLWFPNAFADMGGTRLYTDVDWITRIIPQGENTASSRWIEEFADILTGLYSPNGWETRYSSDGIPYLSDWWDPLNLWEIINFIIWWWNNGSW